VALQQRLRGNKRARFYLHDLALVEEGVLEGDEKSPRDEVLTRRN
jgi:hypothetical protein